MGLCIYGYGGVGKTTLIGTMPGRGLVIDVPQVEGGTVVLSDVADRIDVYACDEWKDIDQVYWYLKREKHPYRWVAIDSISAFQELAKRKTIRDRDFDADQHQITMQEWGKIGSLLAELIYKFRTLEQHTLWIAQQRKFGGGDEGGPTMLGPDVTPFALGKLLPSMLLVGRLSAEHGMDGKVERQLLVGPHQMYYTKYRSVPGRDVPRRIRNPNLANILGYLLGRDGEERPAEVQETAFIISS